MKYNRDTNIEMLRIIAMLMITLGHYVIHGLWHSSFAGNHPLSSLGWQYVQNLVFALCVIGVNAFVLISGFFRIKLTWHRVVAYVLMCMFYNIMGWGLHSFVSATFDMHGFLKALLVTKTYNWFFRAYWWLLLASPIINKAFDYFTIKESRSVVALCTILNCISGFVLCYENSTGFGPSHLVYMYIIGAWLKKEYEGLPRRLKSWELPLAVYLFMSIILSVVALICQKYPLVNVAKIYAYNNPLVIISSLSVFLLFKSIRLQNIGVNRFAHTVVGVLFIQEIVLFPWAYTFIQRHYTTAGDGIEIVLWILLVLALLWASGCFIEYIRKWFSLPISNKISSWLDEVAPIFE